MALKIIQHGSKAYQQMVDMRMAILRKPLGLDFTKEELDREKEDVLIGCFEEDKLEGCCLLTKADTGTVKLRQMAVTSGLQGKGIGRVLLHFAENVARDKGYKKITMNARKNALGFYEKLGYKVVGNEFIEVTIPHFTMEKDL
jgi:GNAT superfamily N-acetyltransferase